MKKIIAAFILLCSSVWAEQPIVETVTSNFASGDTVDSISISIRAKVAGVKVVIPDIGGTPTATLDILSGSTVVATKAAIAEDATTYLDPADFGYSGVPHLPIETGFTFRYTLTTATTVTLETITTTLWGDTY